MKEINDFWDWLPPIVEIPCKLVYLILLYQIALFIPIALVRKWHWLYKQMWEWDVY